MRIVFNSGNSEIRLDFWYFRYFRTLGHLRRVLYMDIAQDERSRPH